MLDDLELHTLGITPDPSARCHIPDQRSRYSSDKNSLSNSGAVVGVVVAVVVVVGVVTAVEVVVGVQ